MTNPSDDQKDRRRAGGLILGSAVLSAIAVGALAYTATNAAFSGTTGTANQDFDAALVTITDDDFATSTNLSVTDMVPGETSSGCILVTYTGNTLKLDGIRVYGSSSGALLPDLDLTIRHGVAGGTCAAPGALTTVYATGALGSLGTDYASGSVGLTPGGFPETVPYLIDVQLDPLTSNLQQGAQADATFTWEVRST